MEYVNDPDPRGARCIGCDEEMELVEEQNKNVDGIITSHKYECKNENCESEWGVRHTPKILKNRDE